MFWEIAVVILGLCVFEIISSVDNAIINAHVLKTLPDKYRKIFLFWGILFAVFAVRGLLPLLIVWLANPALSVGEIFGFIFENKPEISEYLESSKPFLLLGGGIYFVFVFLSWLFLEEKKYAFFAENFIHRQGFWFYAFSSLTLTSITFIALQVNPTLALASAFGTSAFFLTDGFKKNAEAQEKKLLSPGMSAWSKILYLEVLDASFSIDGVIGAFAFTISIPLIILGNGLGAIVVRQLTIKGIDLIAKFAYLKNGALYSIGVLGTIMVLESFGKEYPFWMAPVATLTILGLFLFLSWRELKAAHQLEIHN
jgi:hypothetical protein